MKNINKIKEDSKDVELMKVRRIKMLKNKCRKLYNKALEKTNSHKYAYFTVKIRFDTKLGKIVLNPKQPKQVKFSKEEIEEIKQKAIAALTK